MRERPSPPAEVSALAPSTPAEVAFEGPEIPDDALDALLGRVTALHDVFKRREFEFRLRLGRELLDTLYGGRYDEYQDRRRTKSEALARFCQRHRAALDARELREDALRKYVRVAELVPKDLELPEYVTFSHLLELVALPERERAWFLRNKVLKGAVGFNDLRDLVRQRLAELRARAIEDEELGLPPDPEAGPVPDERPSSPKRTVGHVPRRLDSLLNEALSMSRELAPEILKRPDVAGEALERWLKLRAEADWWVKRLQEEE